MTAFTLYIPPLDEKTIEDHRNMVFTSEDQEMYLHIGHFITWYAVAEFTLTMFVHTFSGSPPNRQFHELTRGMDGKVKVERLRKLISLCGWQLSPGLNKRIEHFYDTIIPLRNLLVHSYLYWPKDDDLQLTSIGTPPQFSGHPQLGDPPKKVSGITLYERGTWLHAFAEDLGKLFITVPRPLPPQGTLGTDNLRSSLPSGRHHKTGPKASPAKKHTQPQKQKRGG